MSFAYEEGNDVLEHVSFVAPPGSVTAFVGSSGSGKSTAAALAASFRTPRLGVVRIDVRPSRECRDDRERLHRNAALDQPRNVDVPSTHTPKEISVPEEGVRVEVGHEEGAVQAQRLLGRGAERPLGLRVHVRGDDRGEQHEEDERRGGERGEGDDDDAGPFAGHVSPLGRA